MAMKKPTCRICGLERQKRGNKMFFFELEKPYEIVLVCGDCVSNIVVQYLEHSTVEVNYEKRSA